jgi:hypothetical protein
MVERVGDGASDRLSLAARALFRRRLAQAARFGAGDDPGEPRPIFGRLGQSLHGGACCQQRRAVCGSCGWAGGDGLAGRKNFFFEKRSKKTFDHQASVSPERLSPIRKSFLLLFSKKKSFLPA